MTTAHGSQGDQGVGAESEGLLTGVRILDFTRHISGPYGSMLLADLGAEVIKVESLNGDPQRRLAPRKGDVGVLFASVNRNKRSVSLDMRAETVRPVLRRLAQKCDVIFHNFRPGVMDEMGLSFDDAKKANSRVIYASLTGYGLTGPRRDMPAYDLAIQALSGGMSITGEPEGSPVRSGIPIADLCGGMASAFAITSALARRATSDKAILLDCSLFDTQISLLAYWAGIYLNTGQIPVKQGSGNSNITPYGAVHASDGYLVIAPYSATFWVKLCDAIRRPDLVSDARFTTNDLRVANRDALEEILDAEFSKRTVADWMTILEEYDVPCSRISDIGEAMNDPQIAGRDMRLKTEIDGEVWEFAGNPIKTVPELVTPNNPPPSLGEHTDEILTGFADLSPAEIVELRAAGAIA